MKKLYELELDLIAKRNTLIKNINLVQDDVGNVFRIAITHDKEPYNLTGIVPKLVFRLPDNTTHYNNTYTFIDETNGVVEFDVDVLSVTQIGIIKAGVQLESGGKRLTTTMFKINVIDDVVI